MFSRRPPVEVEGKAERPRSATTVDNQTRSKTMKRIAFAVATALILGALTLALPKLKSDAKANPVAKPAAPQMGPDACKNVKFQFKSNRHFGEVVEYGRKHRQTCAFVRASMHREQILRGLGMDNWSPITPVMPPDHFTLWRHVFALLAGRV